MKTWPTLLAVMAITLTTSAQTNLKLKYDRPASYFEEALVIGNGTTGGTIYGGTNTDRISLNDITLWTGEPDTAVYNANAYKAIPEIRAALEAEDYALAEKLQHKVQGHFTQSYLPLGFMTIEWADTSATPTDYYRNLDISNSIAATGFKRNGYSYTTTYFASAPDQVMVIKLITDNPSGINATVRLDSQLPCTATAYGNEVAIDGYGAYHSYPNYYREIDNDKKLIFDPARGTRFTARIKARTDNGSVKPAGGNALKIENASEVTLFVATATSFNGYDKNPASAGNDNKAIAANRINKASTKSYNTLLSAHQADYHRLFDRVKINLGTTDPAISALPTDERLLRYTTGSISDPELEALYFQFGRYLLISSSRTPGVPANLQGLWNEKLLPPWSCNYTININAQENYWPAEVTNLSELHTPLLDLIDNMSRGSGPASAKAYYGIDKGWCAGHNTDVWAMTCPVGLGTGSPNWANWNMGGAWLATHIWEHYLFNRDKDELQRYYPALKGAAEFCMDWMIEKNGELITSPSTSPENKFVTPSGLKSATLYGATADLAIIRECLIDARDAAKALGTDKELIKRIDATLPRIRPYQVGANGNLQEWYHDWADQDPHHRHQSHLIGLFPGHHITPSADKRTADAAARTLQIKGDKTTGWSTGWRVNLYARLADAAGAYHTYRKLLNYVSPDAYQGADARRGGGTYPNMLDAHSPFQIDGNFGGTAGVAEMLMQSTDRTVTLLPALPAQWRNGSVSGLKARGGFEVDMTWRDGRVTNAAISSPTGGKTTVKVNGKSHRIKLGAGQRKELTF